MTEGEVDRATGLDEGRKGWLVVVLSSLGTGVALMHYIVLGFMIGPIEREPLAARNAQSNTGKCRSSSPGAPSIVSLVSM